MSLDLAGWAPEVAPTLLGARLVAGGVTVRLTEVEAYGGPADPGSHARHGRTPRTAPMFGPPGRAYVYFSYGMHWCVNVVTGPDGEAGAVLLRAAAVEAGWDLARGRRPGAADRELARGPARLARCLGLTGADSGGPLCLLPAVATVPAARIRSGPRVGVAGPGATTPWRFWLDGEPSVSAYRPGGARRRGGAGVPAASVPADRCETMPG
ncbi:MAG: DNA-3-methyladenine glycosylase [Mycobacteriales bacterium]